MTKQAFQTNTLKAVKARFESIGIECGRVRNREDGSTRLRIGENVADIRIQKGVLFINNVAAIDLLTPINAHYVNYEPIHSTPVLFEIADVLYCDLGMSFRGGSVSPNVEIIGYSDLLNAAHLIGDNMTMYADCIAVDGYCIAVEGNDFVIYREDSIMDPVHVDPTEPMLNKQIKEAVSLLDARIAAFKGMERLRELGVPESVILDMAREVKSMTPEQLAEAEAKLAQAEAELDELFDILDNLEPVDTRNHMFEECADMTDRLIKSGYCSREGITGMMRKYPDLATQHDKLTRVTEFFEV